MGPPTHVAGLGTIRPRRMNPPVNLCLIQRRRINRVEGMKMDKRKWFINAAFVVAALFVVNMWRTTIQQGNDAIANNSSFLYENCLERNEAAERIGMQTQDCEAEHLQ